MPDHAGRRRKRSRLPLARLAVLAGALATIGVVLALPEPRRATQPVAPPLSVAPSWAGPAPVRTPSVLADGASYTPRIFLTADTSVGLAEAPDGTYQRLVLRSADRVVELRRVGADDHPQFDGFVTSGNALVWAESVSPAEAAVRTTLWRTNWRTAGRPSVITSDTGEANFFGGQSDIVLQGGRAYWAALGPGQTGTTEIRSVPIGGGTVTTKRLTGEFGLSSWPWAVSATGGRGVPIELVNLTNSKRVRVTTNIAESAACGPQWCRMAVIGDNEIVRIDVQRPDGTDRRRIAGNEATPTLTDVAILDRYIPLATDRGNGSNGAGGGLSLHDLKTGKTDLVATSASNIQARNGLMWWSTGAGADLVWLAVDLRDLP